MQKKLIINKQIVGNRTYQRIFKLDSPFGTSPLKGQGLRKRPKGQRLQLNATMGTQQIFVTIKIKGQHYPTIINLRATKNFITIQIAQKGQFCIRDKQKVYTLFTVDKQPITGSGETVDKETCTLDIEINKHQKGLAFNIVPLRNYNIILKMLQLKVHNLQINQNIEQVKFD